MRHARLCSRCPVVVLGGDTPLALPLILELERKKYVVIASVSTPEAVETLEHKCQGYVRALVLDPFEVHTPLDVLQRTCLTFLIAYNNPSLPALAGIDPIAQIPHQRRRGSLRIALLGPIHPLYHLSSHTPCVRTDSARAPRAYLAPRHVPPLP